MRMEPKNGKKGAKPPPKRNRKTSSSRSNAREISHREFIAATSKLWGRAYTNYKDLPDLATAFASFKETYPRFSETLAVDSLRAQEYAHLEESGRVCLDYCGFGLFSYLQQFEDWESASFALSSLSVNLWSHAIYGAANEGTVECDIRKRIMGYLNIQESEYNMVFTASRGASFKLLADVYPFSTARRLVTMYDYESESLGMLVQRAKERGAKVSDVSFKWPSLRIVSTKLQKLLIGKRNRRQKGSAAGLFVFPVQSRVSGAKYSYQWMSLAQQNGWNVLLDASALGPKDMDSLGLSMFKPDFIIASFYKVFGADPSGFGCLFIRNTAMQSVQNHSGAPAPGIVRIIPFPIDWSSSESTGEIVEAAETSDIPEDDECSDSDFEFPNGSQLIQGVPSFSGPMLGFGKIHSSDGRADGVDNEKDEKSERDDDSSVCDSIEEVSHSPVFSDEGTGNTFRLELGVSPVGSASRTSVSDDQFSGPFSGPLSGPIHNPVCNGQLNAHVPGRLQNPLYEEDNGYHIELKATENMILGNRKHQTNLNSGSQVSRFAGCVLVPHDGDADPRTGEGSCALFTSNNSAPSIQEQASSDLNNGADYVSVDSSSRILEKLSNGNEIEVMGDLHGRTKIQVSDDEHSWSQNESAIKRETEGDFRLLGRREGNRLTLHYTFSPIQDPEDMGSFNRGQRSCMSGEHTNSICNHEGSSDLEDEFDQSEEDLDEYEDKEPEIICKSLDHADMLGLNKSTFRHRYLINWLVSSLLQLHHSGFEKVVPLVHIYGPQIKYDRGASVAFNLYDCHGNLIHPELVQMLADKNNLSLSIGFLKNLQLSENDPDLQFFEESRQLSSKGLHRTRVSLRMEVVTAALSVLSSFEDVYKVWLFVARFLDADFVKKELSEDLNQREAFISSRQEDQ
ncbi:hypothetical protein KP509_16G080600 [Ceratopteris richardii]|nr:hypothetical protein KP509_16G080600 [Ceratopteris richardii]